MIVLAIVTALACAPTPVPTEPDAPTPEPEVESTPVVTLFPHVRLDRAAHAIEFDSVIAIDTTHPDTPDVYLELVVCTPNTREHESLVVTRARPSHIHAAMLAAGLKNGQPGRITMDEDGIVRTPPTGASVRVQLIAMPNDAEPAEPVPPGAWIMGHRTDKPIANGNEPGLAWVFAGSRMLERRGRMVYDADGTGVVIGLTTFGSEVIAPVNVVSPESAVDEPVWIARNGTVPPKGTPVIVRIEAVDTPEIRAPDEDASSETSD